MTVTNTHTVARKRIMNFGCFMAAAAATAADGVVGTWAKLDVW